MAATSSLRMKPGMPSISSTRQMSWKKSWMKIIQPTSMPRGPSAGHLPVEHRHRREVVEHHVADAGVAPADDGVALVGRASWSSSQSNASSITGYTRPSRIQS